MIYYIDNYKSKYPNLSGRELSDQCIRDCLKAYYNAKPVQPDVDSLLIVRDEEGKPYVNSHDEKNVINISVSHSENTFACYAGPCNAGLDIQYRRDMNTEAVIRRFYTGAEAEFVKKHGPDAFYVIWTRKEAFAKYTGKGIAQVVDKTDVSNQVSYGGVRLTFYDEIVGDDLFVSLCINDGEPK